MYDGTAAQTLLFIHPASYTLLSPVRTAARLHTLNLPSPDKTNVNSHYARPARGLNRWPRGRRFYSHVNLRYVANITPRDGVFKNLPLSAICISGPGGKSTCTNLELILSLLLVPVVTLSVVAKLNWCINTFFSQLIQ